MSATVRNGSETLRVGDFVRRLFGDIGTTCDMRIEAFDHANKKACCMWIEGDESVTRRCWFWADELKRVAPCD